MSDDAVDIETLLANYSENFDRSSNATCITALDYILAECLTVMVSIVPLWVAFPFTFHIHQKGNSPNLEDQKQATDNRSQGLPTPWDDIRIFNNVAFFHTITHPANGKSMGSFLGTVVNGTIDRGIGRVLPHVFRHGPMNRIKRSHQSFLLVVQAKETLGFDGALPELVVYLASLHQSRLERNRSDATVYGVVSDGYAFIFVTITHDGVLMQSRRFDITKGDTLTVLGCLKHVLEMSVGNVTPKKDGGEPVEDDESDMDIDSP
jgi:hypothetical protein